MTLEPKKNKKLFFLVAMPRSGNTLLASIMNQNPDVVCTANSITLEIMKDLYLLKTTDVFQNFPDHKSLDNVLDSVYDNYYKHWPQRIIIDRGPVMATGNPGNFELVKKYFKRPFKCIVLLRDLMDVLASYIKWYTKNPDAFPNKYGDTTDEQKLLRLMNVDGAVAKELKAIKNSFNYSDLCHFVKFNDLIKNPKEELQKIYKFLEEPYYPHYFENLKNININGIEYDDTIVGKNMHKLHTGKIEKVYNPYIEKIPLSIREKYGHIKF
jgi:sulfotransferase